MSADEKFEDDCETVGDSGPLDLSDPGLVADVAKMMDAAEQHMGDLRPEFHMVHNGTMHRIGRCRMDDVDDLIGDVMVQMIKDRNEGLMKKPIYLFNEGRLWKTLRFKQFEEIDCGGFRKVVIAFTEIRTLQGSPEHSVVQEKMKAFVFSVR